MVGLLAEYASCMYAPEYILGKRDAVALARRVALRGLGIELMLQRMHEARQAGWGVHTLIPLQTLLCMWEVGVP